ncbi:MAG: hypothetical protein ABJ251_16055 [Paracoccaceae bacterium]
MNMSLDHALMERATSPAMDLSGMPEAFQRAYGPTEPFENEFGELEMPDFVPLPYRGNRKINPRSRGSTRIFATWLDLITKTPRKYGFDSQLECHNAALTMVDPDIAQVHEQFGPVPFIDDDGKAVVNAVRGEGVKRAQSTGCCDANEWRLYSSPETSGPNSSTRSVQM